MKKANNNFCQTNRDFIEGEKMSLSERQQKDFHWFLDNYSELSKKKKYGDSYLVIKDQAVIGDYPSYAEAVELTAKNEKMGSFIVQHCNGKESGYTNYIVSLYVSGKKGE